MSQDYQANRIFQVTTPFGAGTLLFGRMQAVERLSQPFQFDLTLFSEQGELDADQILGQPVAVTIIAEDEQPARYFHGLAADFAQVDWGRLHQYHVTVRPWLWLLTHASDCRVFQNKTVPAIVQEVCQKAGFTDLRLALSGTYDAREYCVQFRESDFNFVSRLLEEEGIFYYFEHSASKHVLVLCDDVAQLTSAPGCDSVPFRPPSGMEVVEPNHLKVWTFQKTFYAGTYSAREFDFEEPTSELEGTSSIARPYGSTRFEVFDFFPPPAVLTSAAVERVAKIRVQELQAPQMVGRGSGNAMGLATGRLFALTDHPRADLNRRYLIKSTSIDMRNNSYFSDSPDSAGAPGNTGTTRFAIEIETLDARAAYRPARVTPKPLVHGLQTAWVVGPRGTEIYTDELGCIKVQFHWDREGKMDENSSCWLRVGQTWAGRNWGAVQIPRVGQEVIVCFVDGDPDQPLIIGCVYNGSNKPPYDLPANRTQSGIRSRSSMDGTKDNCNEIRFEDKKDFEEFYIQAEKDQKVLVKHNAEHSVGNNMTLSVGNNVTPTGGKLAISASESISLTVGASSITLTAASIKISGPLIEIAGTGAVTVNGATVTVDSAAVTVSGAKVTVASPAVTIGASGTITGLVVIPPG